MIKSKKITIQVLKIRWFLVTFTMIAVVASVAGDVVSAIAAPPRAEYTVVIDAGHGGVDGGVTGKSGVKESDLNLLTAKKLGEFFAKAGVNVVYTRKNKNGLYKTASGNFKLEDFAKRKEIIVNAAPDMVVSIHMNSYKPAPYRRGAQVFFNPISIESRALAHAMQNKINAEVNTKYAGRGFSALAGDYYILNCTDAPSVIVECGFLSNPEDEKLLATEEYRKELCYHIFSACMSYLFTLT